MQTRMGAHPGGAGGGRPSHPGKTLNGFRNAGRRRLAKHPWHRRHNLGGFERQPLCGGAPLHNPSLMCLAVLRAKDLVGGGPQV